MNENVTLVNPQTSFNYRACRSSCSLRPTKLIITPVRRKPRPRLPYCVSWFLFWL